MAAAVYNVESLLDNVKLAVNDVAGAWLSDAQYNSFIASQIVEDQGTRTFTKRATGWFVCDGYDGLPYALLFASDTTPFTGESDVTYEVNARGSIQISSGTTAVTSISVTAAVVDFAAVMYELFIWLAAHRAMDITRSLGGDSYSVSGVRAELMRAAEHWQGIRSR